MKKRKGESDLHVFLKKVGIAFLYNHNCFLVASEVYLFRTGQQKIYDLDNHKVIDVLGVGERYNRNGERTNILRGIEVKVSRSDFKNGFVCSGCNFNYVLTPMRLVAPWEVPKEVGLIEYNKYKFECSLSEYDKFSLKGLRVEKKSKFRKIPQHQIDNTIANILKRSKNELYKIIAKELGIT